MFGTPPKHLSNPKPKICFPKLKFFARRVHSLVLFLRTYRDNKTRHKTGKSRENPGTIQAQFGKKRRWSFCLQ